MANSGISRTGEKARDSSPVADKHTEKEGGAPLPSDDLSQDHRAFGDEAVPDVIAQEEAARLANRTNPRKPRKGGARLRIRGARPKH